MLAMRFDNARNAGDLVTADDRLVAGDPLETAVLISLFSDRRASGDDEHDGDRRGWWADNASHPIGSRLWLLHRAKTSAETVARAREYAEEALAWLVADGIASAVRVEAARVGQVLRLSVTIERPGGAGPWTRWWEVSADAV